MATRTLSSVRRSLGAIERKEAEIVIVHPIGAHAHVHARPTQLAVTSKISTSSVSDLARRAADMSHQSPGHTAGRSIRCQMVGGGWHADGGEVSGT